MYTKYTICVERLKLGVSNNKEKIFADSEVKGFHTDNKLIKYLLRKIIYYIFGLYYKLVYICDIFTFIIIQL